MSIDSQPKGSIVKSAADHLQAALELHRAKNLEYGSNNTMFGTVFLNLFPNAKIPEMSSVEDVNRLQLLMQSTNKLMRYASNFHKGGHADSAADLIVYAALLAEATK